MPSYPELGSRTQNVAVSQKIVDFVCGATFESLGEKAAENAKTFLMDTLAVGVAGRCSAGSDRMYRAAAKWGRGDQARIIGRPDVRFPAPTAAFLNGYQVHCLEWDALHEGSVVIAMCAPVAALCAEAEQNPVCGKAFLTALAVAVEVSVTLGNASQSAPKFFRPAVCGLMGAAMGIAHLRGYSHEETLQTLGLAYSQASGTMQAHWEGAMALAAQVGFAARGAIFAADMAEAGVGAPVDVILGKFGFFTLFESADIKEVETEVGAMGGPWKITQMAHKPYPAGRATQSVLTMFRRVRAKHTFDPQEIDRICVLVPPLIMLLVGRPLTDAMTSAYSRLCLKFIGPMMLLNDDIDPRLFPEDAPPSEEIRALGKKFDIQLNDITDPNALGPQSCRIVMKSGEVFSAECADPYGSFANPMKTGAQEDKVRRCFEVSGTGADPAALISLARHTDELDDMRSLLATVCE